MIGTIGHSGNAQNLQKKNLPPHLHFAYVRGAAPLAGIRDSVDGLVAPFARRAALARGPGVLIRCGKAFHGCYALMQHAPLAGSAWRPCFAMGELEVVALAMCSIPVV